MIYREAPTEDNLEPRRTELHEWANAWTAEIAKAVGGLNVPEFWRVRTIVHEIRVRATAGDLTYPEAKVSKQLELLK